MHSLYLADTHVGGRPLRVEIHATSCSSTICFLGIAVGVVRFYNEHAFHRRWDGGESTDVIVRYAWHRHNTMGPCVLQLANQRHHQLQRTLIYGVIQRSSCRTLFTWPSLECSLVTRCDTVQDVDKPTQLRNNSPLPLHVQAQLVINLCCPIQPLFGRHTELFSPSLVP